MNDIRQERPNGGPSLMLNKRFKETSLNKKFGRHAKEFMVFQALKKINSIAFLEVKLLAEKSCQWRKIEDFPKVEDQLIQKRGNISIRYLVYSQKLHC